MKLIFEQSFFSSAFESPGSCGNSASSLGCDVFLEGESAFGFHQF